MCEIPNGSKSINCWATMGLLDVQSRRLATKTSGWIYFHHRSLVEVIKERISDPHTGSQFHMEPYELLWKPSDGRGEERLHGEIYTSPSFHDAHRQLQESPREPGCDVQRVVAALMFWSDSTHLTSFGTAHLWPLYLYFGNESKYRRCKPTCNLCSHVAYFQSLSPHFNSVYNHN